LEKVSYNTGRWPVPISMAVIATFLPERQLAGAVIHKAKIVFFPSDL
jgi:hypothetical protein